MSLSKFERSVKSALNIAEASLLRLEASLYPLHVDQSAAIMHLQFDTYRWNELLESIKGLHACLDSPALRGVKLTLGFRTAVRLHNLRLRSSQYGIPYGDIHKKELNWSVRTNVV